MVNFQKADPKSLPKFQKPEAASDAESAEKLKRQNKKALEQLAVQEAQMTALLEELDAARQAVATSEKNLAELEALAASAKASADILEFDEATTRTRIIDSMIAAAGWNVAGGEDSTDEVIKEQEVDGQPTQTGRGFVDYVLLVDRI